MPNSHWRALAVALFALPLAPLVAEEFAKLPPPFRTGAAKTNISTGTGLFSGAPIERITLREAINLAVRNNLEARFDHAGIRVEHARMRFEAGAFDPTFSINMSRDSLRRLENTNDFTATEQLRQERQIAAITANTNAIRSAQGLPPLDPNNTTSGINDILLNQETDRASSSFIQRTPWGMRYGFFVEANRLRSTFTGDTRTIIPEYLTSVQVQVVQPLLKDFGPAANLANLRVARIAKRNAILTWKQRLMTGVQSVMQTYYEMLYALSDIRVRQDAISADEKLVQQNQRRVEVGFMQPFDVQQARAQVSVDTETLLTAKNVFMERQFALKRLILEQFNVNDARLFLPNDAPVLNIPKLDRALFLQLAFANRVDFQQALADADAQDIRLRFARNQLLPQLDLVGTYGVNGLTEQYHSSFEQAFKGHAPSWSLGFNFRVPLGNVQARAQLDLAKAQKEQAILKIKEVELGIGVDVDTVISRIETNRQRVETARKTRELYDEALRIAYRRLEEGQISSFDIIEQQRRLYDAKSRELAAQAELNKSITQLWLATGTVLDQMGIRVAEPDDIGSPVLPVAQRENF